MKRLLLGVIGHVDHGKTALVRALTGMETDRLEEEKRRGISIALGFAHFAAGDAEIDLIDMPGHERFVRTMIAGATGIDAVLLVVAANEGIKPQTVEHVDVAALLGLTRAVIAISKADLVSPERLRAVAAEAAALAARAGLAAPPPVPVSAQTGEGIEALRRALLDRLDGAAPPADHGFCFLPVDRAFSLSGHGAVVTGTLRRGGLAASDALELLPGARPVRVRGLQVHGRAVSEARPGQRVAVNLRGAEIAALARGQALATPGLLRPAIWLSVALRLVDGAPPVGGGARLRLFCGTAEAEARLRLLDRDALEPGDAVPAQLQCAVPVAVPARERFILRAASPARTLGGGIVLDPEAARLRRHDPAALARLARLQRETPEQTVAREVAEAGPGGRGIDRLARLAGLAPARVLEQVQGQPVVVVRGAVVLPRARFEDILAAIPRALAAAPDGLTPDRLRATLPPETAPAAVEEALVRLVAQNRVRQEAGVIRPVRAAQDAARAAREQELARELAETLRRAALTPPDPKQVMQAHPAARRVLEQLTREGVLVRTYDRVQKREILFHRDAIRLAQRTLEPGLARSPGLLVREAGAALGISRKYSVPLLEYLDAIQYTKRVEDRRMLARHPG